MKILLFGATGSIGKQTVDVIKHQHFSLVGISYYYNKTLADKIIKENNVKYYFSPAKGGNVNSYDELIKKTKPDLIVNAVLGFAGLELTVLAINHKIDIALANKESLVVAGKLVTDLANKNHVKIYPIDSEHSAIYQAIKNNHKALKQIYITASGGPFYNKKIKNVTVKQAINHPNWKMGAKISVDSATLMNKCFEMIEAYWLFNIKNITPIYHPQCIVHSMVEFKDNTIVSIMSNPDMRLPIQLGLNKFDNSQPSLIKPLDFHKLSLSFDLIDDNKWLPIKWAKKCLKNPNSSLPIVLNAANEELVHAFLDKKIKFNEIIKYINIIIKSTKLITIYDLDQVNLVDDLTRKLVQNLIK